MRSANENGQVLATDHCTPVYKDWFCILADLRVSWIELYSFHNLAALHAVAARLPSSRWL